MISTLLPPLELGAKHPGYPEGWKVYIAIRRKAREHFAENPGGTVQTAWQNPPCDRPAWAKECLETLHRRINVRAGEAWRNETTQEEIGWRRDYWTLRNYRSARIVSRGSGFNTPEMRQRFPELQAKMTEDWDEF